MQFAELAWLPLQGDATFAVRRQAERDAALDGWSLRNPSVEPILEDEAKARSSHGTAVPRVAGALQNCEPPVCPNLQIPARAPGWNDTAFPAARQPILSGVKAHSEFQTPLSEEPYPRPPVLLSAIDSDLLDFTVLSGSILVAIMSWPWRARVMPAHASQGETWEDDGCRTA